jgi:hypothetical protein
VCPLSRSTSLYKHYRNWEDCGTGSGPSSTGLSWSSQLGVCTDGYKGTQEDTAKWHGVLRTGFFHVASREQPELSPAGGNKCTKITEGPPWKTRRRRDSGHLGSLCPMSYMAKSRHSPTAVGMSQLWQKGDVKRLAYF